MAFGILEPSTKQHPQGTVLLEEVFQHGGGSAEVILVPQPSDSPKDPLNWPRVRKELAFAAILFGCCTTGVIGPLLVPGFNIVAANLDVSLTKVALLNGALVMGLGFGVYVCGALATVCGNRMLYLVTSALLVPFTCWGAAAQSYNSLLAARVFQGLAMSSFWGLGGTASINNMYFVHQRGRRVGLWNLAVIASTNLAPVISGHIIVGLGWRWSFWLLAIFFSMNLVLTVLIFPETSFPRASTPTEESEFVIIGQIKWSKESPLDDKAVAAPPQPRLDIGIGSVIETSPMWKRVLGVETVEMGNTKEMATALISPLLLLRHPAVVWGCLMWMANFSWIIIQGSIATQIWTAPPYNMSATAVGNLVGIAPLIGSVLGCLIGGTLSDLISQMTAKRNNGVFEPEFRLIICLISLVTITIGTFGLGEAIERGFDAIITGVLLAILNFAVGVGCTAIVTYLNDTCQHRSGEAFGLAMLVKSAFAFGLSFVVNDYYAAKGPRVFFITFGAMSVGLTMLTLPLYVWGKQIRAWSEKRSMI